MSSEFQEFLKLIGKLIVWIFKMTINLICAVFLVAACIAIWRIPWICASLGKIRDSSDFREICFMQFMCTIFDYMTIIPFFIAILSPTRIYHIIAKIYKKMNKTGSYTGDDYYYSFSTRAACWENAGIGMIDTVCLAFGLMSAVIPTRTVAFFRIVWYFGSDYFKDDYIDLRIAWFQNGALAVFDVFMLPHCIAIIFPTRTYSLMHDIYSIRFKNERPPNWVFQKDYLHYNVDYRWAILRSFWIGFVDLFNIPLFIVCMLSVYNGVEIIHLMQDYRYRWNNRIRLKILKNFAMIVFDIVFVLPLLLLVVVTGYRVPCVYKHVRHSWDIYYKIRSNELTPDEVNNDTNKALNVRMHILLNCLLLIYDLILTLISLVFLCLTVYRLRDLLQILRNERGRNSAENENWNPFSPNNSDNTHTNTNSVDKYEEYKYELRQRLLICQQFEFLILDLPCFIAAAFVYMTLWRAKILHKQVWSDIPQQIEENKLFNQALPANESKKRKQTSLAILRRYAALWQFAFLWRDFLFMIAFVIIVGTLYRLPFVILALLSKLHTPNIKDREVLEIEEATLEIPEKGKITIKVKGRKPESLCFSDTSVVCRLYVLGTKFWDEVGNIFGGTIKTAGQSQLPNKWTHQNGFDYDLVMKGQDTVDIVCTLQTPELKRKVIHNNIGKLEDHVATVLQLECDDKDIGILAIFIVTVKDLVQCSVIDGDGLMTLQKTVHFGCSQEKIAEIRGTEFPSVVDAFWVIVAEQFFYLIRDIIHLLLFVLPLVMAPWRFVKCCLLLFRNKEYWYVQEHDRAMGMLEHSYFIYKQFYYHYFQPMMNDMVKEEYEYHARDSNYSIYSLDSLHINYNHYYQKLRGKLDKYWHKTYEQLQSSNADNPKQFNMSLTTYDEIIAGIEKKLSKIKPVPASKDLCRDYFEQQNVRLYLKMMHSTLNLFLMNKKISVQHHAILAEQLHVENVRYEEQMEKYHSLIHDSHKELHNQYDEKAKNTKCLKKLFSKDLSMMQKMIRLCFMKACQDIAAFVIIIFIICTIYRTVPFFRDVYHVIQFKIAYFKMKKNKDKIVGPSFRFGLKKVITKHVIGFANDVSNLLQMVLYTALIIVTLVRFTDYLLLLADGGRERGETRFSLECAVEIAKETLRGVADDLWQIIALVTAWKYYKFTMASAVFGFLLPSTAFLEIYAFICGCCPRKLRLYLAIFTWFALLATVIYYLTDMGHGNVDVKVFIILSMITLFFTFLFYLLLFCCYKRKSYDLNDENEAFYRNQSTLVPNKSTRHISEIYKKQCIKCDSVLMKDTITNIETRLAREYSGSYYYHWYNRRCEFCRDYLYGYNIGYHCQPCNITVCHWCSRHLKDEKSNKNKSELHKGLIPGGWNSAHIREKLNDIGIILWSYPNDGYVALHVRFTWPNVLSYFCMFWEIFQLIAVLLYVIYIPNIDTPNINEIGNDKIFKVMVQSSKWLLLAHKNTNENWYETVSVIFIILGFFWIIICSLPLVCEQLFNFVDKRGTFTQSTMWIKCGWFFTRILYVFLIINWVRMFQCINSPENGECVIVTSQTHKYDTKGVFAFIVLLFYWLTAGITVVYNNAQIVMQQSFHFDIIYPIVFAHALQLLQSLFIISGMLLVLYDTNNALLFCLILSYLMLIWHLVYGLISKQFLKDTANNDLILSFSSIPHMVILRIFLYITFCYNTTILYVYFTANNNMNIGPLMLYGSVIIMCNALIIAFIYHRYYLKKERERLSKSTELKECLKLLSSLYNRTEENGIIGNWNKDGATQLLSQIIDENESEKDIKTSTSKLFSVSQTAHLIIEFERHILFERLTETFLNQRKTWIRELLECDSFNDLIPLILELVNAIQIPPFYTVALRILCNNTMFMNAPLVLCNLVMQFVDDNENVSELCNIHLTDINKIPSTVLTLDKWGKYFSIAQTIDRFGPQITDKIKTFVTKTLFWNIHKKERLYASYLTKSQFNSFVTDRVYYKSNFKTNYFVLLPQYLVWFHRKVEMESLEQIPTDYIDLTSLQNEFVIGHGETSLVNDDHHSTGVSIVNEEKYDENEEKLSAENERKMRTENKVFVFQCQSFNDDSIYHWYRYYWWYNQRKSHVFGALNSDTYKTWVKHFNKALQAQKKKNKKSALEWAAGIDEKISEKNKGKNEEKETETNAWIENPWSDLEENKESKSEIQTEQIENDDWARFDEDKDGIIEKQSQTQENEANNNGDAQFID